MQKFTECSRRGFLKGCMAAGAAPVFIPSGVIGADAPSKKVNIAMIGVGRQGTKVNLATLINMPDVRVMAVCDVDKWRVENARTMVNKQYADNACRVYGDWREVLEQGDVDAVMVSTPDHWHIPIALAAVKKGKHVSCEKPLSLSIHEGRVIADAARQRGVVFRTDSECRTHAYMHKIATLARNGYLGKIKRVEVGVPAGDEPGGNPAPMPVPAGLDYDMWTGPAPVKEYTLDRVHPVEGLGRPGWMRCRDYCEGMITNWGTHLIDVAHLAMDKERTGPVSIEGTGEYPAPGSGLWDVLVKFRVQYKYADDVVMDYVMDQPYLLIEGEEGWIRGHWHSKGGLTASDPKILGVNVKDAKLQIPQRSDKGDFIYCIQNGVPQESMADAEVGHRTCSMGQLGHISIQLGRKLTWDPVKEKFANDSEADAKLVRSYRAPWGLES